MSDIEYASTVSPKLLPGVLDVNNQNAMDWGWQNLVAYGCQSYVVVVDPMSMQIIQTLDSHRAKVVQVRWSPKTLYHDVDEETPEQATLATGDLGGVIIIWNVVEAKPTMVLHQPGSSRAISFLQFHPTNPDLLAAVHAPHTLVMWNIRTGEQVWKKGVNFPEGLVSLAFNPFDPTHVCLAAKRGFIYFLKAFDPEVRPTRADRQYRVTGRMGAQHAQFGEILQMEFSPHTRNIMYFVLPREVILFDLLIHQTVGSIALDKERAPFCRLLLCRSHPTLLFCLHSDGALTSWAKAGAGGGVAYNFVCDWDMLKTRGRSEEEEESMAAYRVKRKKVSRKWRNQELVSNAIYGITNGPLNETRLSVIANDGRFSIWDFVEEGAAGAEAANFTMLGRLENLSSLVSCVRVSPFAEQGESLVAVGTVEGVIHVYDLVTSSLFASYKVHAHAVKGIAWASYDTVLSFSVKQVSRNRYQNFLSYLNMQEGSSKEVRRVHDNVAEDTYIRSIKLSVTGLHLAVLLKERPAELWELSSYDFSQITPDHPLPLLSALEWLPPLGVSGDMVLDLDDAPESSELFDQFVCTTVDGIMLNFVLQNHAVVEGPFKQPQLGLGIVSTLVCKDNLLVSGDTIGTIHVWNFLEHTTQTFVTYRGLVRRLRFAPGPNNHNIVALFHEGDYGVWDLDVGQRISTSMRKERDLRAIDVDWAGGMFPLVANTDGAMRVFDISLTQSNSGFRQRFLSEPVRSPAFLPKKDALYMKGLMQMGLDAITPYIPASVLAGNVDEDDNMRNCYGEPIDAGQGNSYEVQVAHHFALVPPDALQRLTAGVTSTVERCLIAAEYFGEDEDMSFWQLARQYLGHFQRRLADPAAAEAEDAGPVRGTKVAGSAPQPLDPAAVDAAADQLPEYFDLLRTTAVVRHKEMARADVHAAIAGKRSSYELTQKSSQQHVLLGNRVRAAEMLLETRQDSPFFYRDALKACVIAATISQEAFSGMVSEVANKLIDHINVDEGVELLCLTGNGADACAELQKHQRWVDAALLAKSSLPADAAAQVHKEWAMSLMEKGQRDRALHILLSMGEFHLVLKFLYEFRRLDTAAMFAQALREAGLLSSDQVQSAVGSRRRADTLPNIEGLLESIRQDYAEFLDKIGNSKAANEYRS